MCKCLQCDVLNRSLHSNISLLTRYFDHFISSPFHSMISIFHRIYSIYSKCSWCISLHLSSQAPNSSTSRVNYVSISPSYPLTFNICPLQPPWPSRQRIVWTGHQTARHQTVTWTMWSRKRVQLLADCVTVSNVHKTFINVGIDTIYKAESNNTISSQHFLIYFDTRIFISLWA